MRAPYTLLVATLCCAPAAAKGVVAISTAPAKALARAQDAQVATGTLRGQILDKDFAAPLVEAAVSIVETGQKTLTNDQGNYSLPEIPAGRYTVVVSKEGYVRQVRVDVEVVGGVVRDLDLALSGDYTDMEEFVVQDVLSAPAGSESSLLELRVESPALMDSIGAELMSRAGASDAAGALRLVAGATVQDGKTAVIRGLPDRYVSSQLNGVRMPSANEDKRAVELDQFPSGIIESVQVSKTFTPDQQGDASGGAVNLVLKSIPDEPFANFKGQVGFNSQVRGSDFLSYQGGGVGRWGLESGQRRIQYENFGQNWDGATGASPGDEPFDNKWSVAGGGKMDLGEDVRFGGLLSFFYERDSSYQQGFEDERWRLSPNAPMSPQFGQGTPEQGSFLTSLFDVVESTESVQWGGLATIGLETESSKFGLSWLHTHTAEDSVIVATDTRGKQAYFRAGYDPNDLDDFGNQPENLQAAPYIRTDTLQYTERTTGSLQLRGVHTLPANERVPVSPWEFGAPELEWTLSKSFADLDQPDKRLFGAQWSPNSFNSTFGIFFPNVWTPYKPGANFNLGNLQRIWKTIEEDSEQVSVGVRIPYKTATEDRGYLKFGYFGDLVDRRYDQDTFSNPGEQGSQYEAGFDQPWSAVFPGEDHPLTPSETDVDYDGSIDLEAFYAMIDYPFDADWKAVGGVRVERTNIVVTPEPEGDVYWYPNGVQTELNPGDADVDQSENDILPSLGVEWKASSAWTFRGAVSRTVARQTFKELTPIIQQEFLGGPVFIGNKDLEMSGIANFDLRADFVPTQGTLVSFSLFHKEVTDAIEYVQVPTDSFTYTTAVNYPKGSLSGIEFEARQGLWKIYPGLEGVSVGGNATFISSEVTLPDDEAAEFEAPNIQAPMRTRDMTAAPEQLLNLYATWDIEESQTQLALFWTLTGDTLVAGAAVEDGIYYVPNIYARSYDTLNLSLTQTMGIVKWQLQVKNLTNPEIQEVYRSDYIGDDVPKSSYTKGIEYSLGFSLGF